MKSLNKKLLAIITLMACSHFSFAQQYKYRAAIDSVQQTGFYKIVITPQLSAQCKTNFSDIRIANSSGQWVPYIVRGSFPYLYNSVFTELTIGKNELADSGKSILIIKNPSAQSLYKLSLVIKNNAVNRFATLSGSNDSTHWFIINEKILLGEAQVLAKDHYIQTIQFPSSNYKFFKLLINNAGTDPLAIEKAGIYNEAVPRNESRNFSYVKNPVSGFQQKDSTDGKSYIKITTDNVQFDRIKVDIASPKFYLRKAALYLPGNDSIAYKLDAAPVSTFLLQANTDNTFDVARLQAKIIYIVITNDDNPSLKIKGVATLQVQREIVAYLEKNKTYSLQLDNATASQPDYDLEKFRDSIPSTIDSISIGALIGNKKIATVVIPLKTPNKTWLWIVISLAGLLLTYFTFRLTRDINKTDV